MSDLRPIETKYKGHRFRSRLEARWAVWLDHASVRWEYEKEGYRLPSGLYLPDFWIPDSEVFLEIKGQDPTQQEIQLATELEIASGKSVAILAGPCTFEGSSLYVIRHRGEEDWIEASKDQRLTLCRKCDRLWYHSFSGDQGYGSLGTCCPEGEVPAHREDFYGAASSARFEFGESG